MNGRKCARYMRAELPRRPSPRRIVLAALVSLCLCAICNAQPEIFGEWNDPPGADGPKWWSRATIGIHVAPLGVILCAQYIGCNVWIVDELTGTDTHQEARDIQQPERATHDIFCSSAVTLVDGSVLIVGGHDGVAGSNAGVKDVSIYRTTVAAVSTLQCPTIVANPWLAVEFGKVLIVGDNQSDVETARSRWVT